MIDQVPAVDNLRLLTTDQLTTMLESIIACDHWTTNGMKASTNPRRKEVDWDDIYFELIDKTPLGRMEYVVRLAPAKLYDFPEEMSKFNKAKGFEITLYYHRSPHVVSNGELISVESTVAWQKLATLFDCNIICGVNDRDAVITGLSLVDIDLKRWPIILVTFIVVLAFIYPDEYALLRDLEPKKPLFTKIK